MSNKFPDADAAHPETTYENHCSRVNIPSDSALTTFYPFMSPLKVLKS